MTEAITLTAAYLLDLAIGDPKWLPHPVRGMGWAIEKMERVLRRQSAEHRLQNTEHRTQNMDRVAGVLLVIIIVGVTYAAFYFINKLILSSHFPLLTSYLSFIVLAILTATTIATRELINSAKAVIDEVKTGNVETARGRLGMIVGRDTQSLDRKGILKATIETLSENASDGIVAPLFYFALGGLPLAMAYKAVNTLDSMVGYKNETYRNFGWAAARLDDIANYIPARITGILIVVASYFVHYSLPTVHYSLKMMLRDGRKHSSPNSGVPEAAIAGALGVQLGGPSMYGGILVEKPFIGEERQQSTEHRKQNTENRTQKTDNRTQKTDNRTQKTDNRTQTTEHRLQTTEHRTQTADDSYYNAARQAVSIIRLTSLLGFAGALGLLYIRTAT
ncbi:MAG: cobalamin biosynthesis protein CobD [Nitrospiraceae bacterium]|nr:MAG: cobalamin biosynthesis protein CobD [Nitrospiraceae bacterium]